MDIEVDPIVGNWYRRIDKGQLFRVVGFDDDGNIVEVQHFDGDLEEIELTDWFDLDLELTAAPEDWTGPVDDVDTDDLGYTETDMAQSDWQAPLEANPAPKEEWEDDQPEDERDEWAEGEST